MIRDIIDRVTNSFWFYCALYCACLIGSLAHYYTNGSIIFGMEGNYVLDFNQHLAKYGFAWFSEYGLGLTNMSPAGTGLNIVFLAFIQRITGSAQLANFVLVFFMYFSPFFSMYLVSNYVTRQPRISFLISLFYVVNPLMFNYLTSMNQWNVFSVAVMPLFLWLILRFFNDRVRLFFYFGVVSACFSFAFTNQPMLVVILLSLFTSCMIACYYHYGKFKFLSIVSVFLLLFASFLLFNAWWILVLYFAIPTAQKMYTMAFASSWLGTILKDSGAVLTNAFLLRFGITPNSSYNFIYIWSNTFFAYILSTIPFMIISYFFLTYKEKKDRIFYYSIMGMVLVLIFLAKGIANPFGWIYLFLFNHVPFFYIFKSPVDKFGMFFLFILTVFLIFIYTGLKKDKYLKFIITGLSIYVVYFSVPLLIGKIIPDSSVTSIGVVTRKYSETKDITLLRKDLDRVKNEYRILSTPATGNYQICLARDDGKFYTGIDPILSNVNKAFIGPQDNLDWLYKKMMNRNYLSLLGIYNISKILVNDNMILWFGNISLGNTKIIKSVLNNTMAATKYGPLTVYDNEDHFLPRFYAVGARE